MPLLAQARSPDDVRPPRKLRLAGEGRGGAEKRRDPGQGKLLLPRQEHTKGDQGTTQGEAEHLEISQSQASAFRQESLTLISKLSSPLQ